MNQIPPWISLAISLISLLGTLLVAWHTQKQERLRLERSSELSSEFEQQKFSMRLNEENWRRVLDGIRKLRDSGFGMTGAFRALANRAWSQLNVPEDQLVSDGLLALKRHEEFRLALKDLRGEIRPKDYESLERLLKYLVIVFLDVGRTPKEREIKIDQMKKHERILQYSEKKFQRMVEHFLQPYGSVSKHLLPTLGARG